MELHLTPEQEAHLSQIAQHEGKDAEQLVKEVALHLLEKDRREREIIREQIKQADRGEFIEEDEMDARFEKMIRD